MNTKHTPGLWEIFCDSPQTNADASYWVDSDGGIVAYINARGARGLANARLIAAAPDLLAALEKLYRLHCGLDSWHEDAMADAWVNACTAIAKAKGEA